MNINDIHIVETKSLDSNHCTAIKPNVEMINFESYGDERGMLVSIESLRDYNISTKRAYVIYDTHDNVTRGKHAHLNLRQILICVSGSCEIDCEYLSHPRTTYKLNSPRRGLLIEGLVWREMTNFYPNTVLLVLADESYNEADYIRDYNNFLNLTKNLLLSALK